MVKNYAEDLNYLITKYGKRDYLVKALKEPNKLSEIIARAQKSNLYVNGFAIFVGIIFLIFGIKGFHPQNSIELRFLIIPGLFFSILFIKIFIQRLNSFEQLKIIGKKHDLLN